MSGLPPMFGAPKPTTKKRVVDNNPPPITDLPAVEISAATSKSDSSIEDMDRPTKKMKTPPIFTVPDTQSVASGKTKPGNAKPGTAVQKHKTVRASHVKPTNDRVRKPAKQLTFGSVTLAQNPSIHPMPSTQRHQQLQQPSHHHIGGSQEQPSKNTLRVGDLDLSQQAREIVPLFERFCDRPHLEIEAKLGRSQNSHFTSGVSEKDFMEIHNMLMSYKKWDNQTDVEKWVPSFDYMLDNNIRVSKTSAGNTFVKKTTLEHVTFICRERSYDVRVSLKEELPVQVRLPKDTHLVRVKKRKSFIYKKRWRFDLTVVWTGKDEQDAQSRPPTHEVECEFIGPQHSAGPNFTYTATSLLEKMIDFLGRDRGPLNLIKV